MIKKILLAVLLLGAVSLGVVFCTFGPPAPTHIQPADGGLLLASFPFTWGSVPEATEYFFEIASDPGFGFVLFDVQTTDTSYDITNSAALELMQPGVMYYWHVLSGNESSWGNPSDYWTFSIISGGKD